MKKTYITPITAYMAAAADELLTISAGVYSQYGIDYGGVDNDGSMVPGARRSQSLWSDEEEGGEEF
jgi:hypothetical protein